MSNTPYYQVVIKRRSGSTAAWFHRPHFATTSFEDIRAQYADALANIPDIVEMVVLTAPTYNELCDEYDHYASGRACKKIDVTDDGIRARLEFAPLRKEYGTLEPKNPRRFDLFSGDELHGYTEMMRRVMAGTLGGPNDGE